MRKFTLTKALCLFVLISFLFACKKDSFHDVDSGSEKDNPTLSYIKSLGFKDKDIRENGDKYIVDGDLVFYKNKTYTPKSTKPSGGYTTNQYGTGSYVTKNNIVIRVDPSMNNYLTQVNQAINQWNNAGGLLRFSIYTGTGSYDINMTNFDLGTGYCGYGDFPSGGNPGPVIYINLGFMEQQSYSVDQIQSTICHEIGHTIGLLHSNQYNPNAQHVPNTPTFGNDGASIMNGGVCGSAPTTLSVNDLWAYKYLYPVPYTISGPMSVCSSGNYTIQNLPSGASVSWSVIGPLSIQSSSTSNAVTVIKSGDGEAVMQAAVTVNGITYNIDRPNIMVGIPTYIPVGQYMVGGETNAITNAYPLYTYYFSGYPGAISYEWHVSGGSIPATIYNNNTAFPFVDVKFNSPGWHQVLVKVVTECGDVWLDNQELEVNVTYGY